VWRQKHTQFRSTGATEHNVIGERIWPTFAMKSIGLMFLVAGVIAAMGALFEVNAVWLYGPYDVAAATSYSQPDWYIGFLEGSLRLFPPWETRAFGYMINNIVYSGVIIPGIIFTGLLVVPWIERHFTKDDREHHLLDRPRDAPHRTAAGAAAITFVTVLFLGGSQDVIADTIDVSIGRVTTVLQILALIAPPITYWFAYHLCVALRRREGPERTERAGIIVRDAGGGYHGIGGEGKPEPEGEPPTLDADEPVTTGSVGE
jgi:ubiquinol-cytochrome c reductase cytochrome b subunit